MPANQVVALNKPPSRYKCHCSFQTLLLSIDSRLLNFSQACELVCIHEAHSFVHRTLINYPNRTYTTLLPNRTVTFTVQIIERTDYKESTVPGLEGRVLGP